jgi:hypothetical protein
MSEEIKEAQTVAEAFSVEDEAVATDPVVEEKEAASTDVSVVDETKNGEVETGSESKLEAEVKQEEKPVEKTEQSWTELGFPQYEGMTKAEIAERISFVNKEYGRATNTIGELRKQISAATNVEATKSEQKNAKSDIIASMPKLSPEQAIEFNEMYEQSPVKAIMMFGGDSVVKKIVQDEISDRVPKDIDTILNEKTERIRYETFLSNHSLTENSPEVLWINKVKTEYLTGQNRPIEELYELSQMWKNKDEYCKQVYSLMKRHPTMTLEEAKNFVPKKNSNMVDKAAIVNNVKKLNNANHTSQTTKVSEDNMKTFASVQEAFDSVE